MCVIPFLFLWKGDRIRAGSRFCIYLKEKKEKELEDLRRERAARTDNEGLRSEDLVMEKV